MITPSDQKVLSSKALFDAFLKERFSGDCAAFLDSLDAGMNHLLRVDLTEAKRFMSSARHYTGFLPPQYEARIISLEARYCLWIGDYRTALKIYRRALRIFKRFRNHEAASRLRKGLVEVHMYLGQYKEAIDTGKRAIRYFREKSLTIDAAQCMTNIGNVYHRMDKNHLALQYYDKARRVFVGKGGIPLAIVDYNRANIHTNLGNLRTAKSLYMASADIYKNAGMEIAEHQAKYAVAYLLFLEARYSDALVAFESVYDAFTRLGDERAAAVTVLDMAELNIQLNQYGVAIMLGDSAASKFREYKMAYEEGKGLFFVALAKLELGDYERAAAKFGQARKLFLKEGNVLWLAMIEHARARLLQARGRHTSALRTSAEAEHLFGKTGDVRRKRDAQLTRLDSLGLLGRSREFKRLADHLRAVKLARYQQYVLHNIEGDFHYGQGRYEEALAQYRLAGGIMEKMMSGIFPDEVQFVFSVSKRKSYLNSMHCYLELGRVKEALRLNLRTISLMNRSSVTRTSLSARVPVDLVAAIDNLRTTLQRLQRFPGTKTGRGAGTDAYATEENRLWYYERRARAYLYDSESNDMGRSPGSRVGLSSVPKGVTLISYVINENLVGAFVSSGRTPEFIDLETRTEELRGLIRKLSFVLERTVSGPDSTSSTPDIANCYLEQLHEIVFAPLEAVVEGDTLVLLTDGDLSQVPFSALLDRKRGYLKDRHELRLAVRPEDLHRTSSGIRTFVKARNAIFGVPSDTLPFVETECEAIERSFPKSKTYCGGGATRETLREELGTADGFVHIAAHASRSCENPLFSRILLSDGPFFPFDLFGTGIRARLVTISGCQTAAPGLYYGNSFSLAKAFYRAGARYVLASLWTVTDEITTIFMMEFYSKLSECDDVGESYRSAVDKIQKATENPAYWSSFVLLGT